MNAEEWRTVKAVLQQAMTMPAAERRAFVDKACMGAPSVQREVDSLLLAHDAEMVEGDPLRDVVEAGRRAEVIPVMAPSDDELRATLQSGLGEQFDVLGMIGRGGMGAVFLAHERALGRTVAIKVLRPDRAHTTGSLERFRREARIAAQLSHPGIVPLHAFGEVNGLWYFVMEYVRGPNLAMRLENETTLTSTEARRILLAIAEALEHAHSRGVIHRDIKPANILIEQATGQPRLSDFGISKFEESPESLTMTGAFVGTPLFMSPEQAEGDGDLDARSDIYSLGAVAYTMLTGRAPFDGHDALDMLARRRLDDVTPIRDVAPQLPADLAHIVMRCLERERSMRWRDAAALANALRNSDTAQSHDLPEVISDLPGYAAYAVAWMVLWTAIAFGSPRSFTSRAIFLLVALLVPIGPALHVWRVRAHGMRGSQLLRLVLRPPKWWGTWWPSRLRGPGDLWRLLPPIARAVRVGVAVFFALLVVFALTSEPSSPLAAVARDVSKAILVIGTPVALVFILRWSMKQRLGFDDTVQFLFFSTGPSSFWRQPHIARLLAPAMHGVRPPDLRVPTDHARAVDELLRRFPTNFSSVAHAVRRAVQHQLAAIAVLDRELALLSRDAGPAEMDRLNTRLTVLGESSPATAVHRDLVESLRRQLDVMGRMQGLHMVAQATRETALAVLPTLWQQLNALLEAEHNGALAVTSAEQRVLSLCTRILEG